jgi:hypothetical protein
MKRINKTLWLRIGAAMIFALAARPASADLWTASANSSDGPLDASANFTISNGQIQVEITNLLNPTVIKSAGQAVSDLVFTISNAPGTNSSKSASGQLAEIGSRGSVTDVSGSPGRWIGLETGNKGKVLGGFGISGKTITLETIGGGQPSEMILPANGGGKYSAANASITDGKFSPFVDGKATFTLNLSGVTHATTISAVTFSFGTQPDHFLAGKDNPIILQPASVPEGSSLAFAGLGALAFAGYALYRKARAARSASR